MKMSSNDFDFDLPTSLNDLEELVRMERPSRVFSSRLQTLTPILQGQEPIYPDQNEQDRFSDFTSTSIRPPYVRFTISNPETRQRTAARQIPSGSSSPGTHTTTYTRAEITDVSTNEASDDENTTENRRFSDHFSTLVRNAQQARILRSARRQRALAAERPPYIISGRISGRRIHFASSARSLLDDAIERSLTPEQELPEVQEQDMELDNRFEVYDPQDSISSVSSGNEVDSGDDRSIVGFLVSENINESVDEENRDTVDLDVSNETPRTRVVPFMSPIQLGQLSPQNNSHDLRTSRTFINNNNDDSSRVIENRNSEAGTPVPVEEHPETEENLNDQLIRLFECPVCFEFILPPIFQCLFGHLICSKCVIMCENCPSCRTRFNSKRNLFMEKVSYLVKFPCKNSTIGCKQKMFFSQIDVHEQECPCKHYQCFFTNCPWKGFCIEMHEHMNNSHGNSVLEGSTQSLEVLLTSANHTSCWFVLAHNEYFAVMAHVFIIPPRRVKIHVNFVGPSAKAKDYKFTVTLAQDPEESSQKLMYERLTLPFSGIPELVATANMKQKDIFSLPINVLEPYLKKRRCRLPFTLKIDHA